MDVKIRGILIDLRNGNLPDNTPEGFCLDIEEATPDEVLTLAIWCLEDSGALKPERNEWWSLIPRG